MVITSNRGLCGSLNSNVIKETTRLVEQQYAAQNAQGNVELYCIGKKGAEVLRKRFNVVFENESMLDTSSFDELSELADNILNQFRNSQVGKVEVVYHKFLNPATQRLEVEHFLPIQKEFDNAKQSNSAIDYIFEPSQVDLLNELIPKALKIQLYKTLLDSIASEHGARMTSMSKATDNASEILKDLKLKYNNARQSAITNELNEIVSGAEALNS